jgi:hypothetical protein
MFTGGVRAPPLLGDIRILRTTSTPFVTRPKGTTRAAVPGFAGTPTNTAKPTDPVLSRTRAMEPSAGGVAETGSVSRVSSFDHFSAQAGLTAAHPFGVARLLHSFGAGWNGWDTP